MSFCHQLNINQPTKQNPVLAIIDCIGFAARSSHQSKIDVHTAWSSKLRKSLILKPDLTLGRGILRLR